VEPFAQAVVEKVGGLFRGDTGLAASVAELNSTRGERLAFPEVEQLVLGWRPGEVEEATRRVLYPLLGLYCERMENRLEEKFTRFSGTLHMVMTVRTTRDRPEELAGELDALTASVVDVLERLRGDLGDGLYLPGTYVVDFEKPKRGGLRFTQEAVVRFPVRWSRR
jgi:hypothetical protein